MTNINILVELARNADAQCKKYCPERKEQAIYLANLCIEEGYPAILVRMARNGTDSLEAYLAEND